MKKNNEKGFALVLALVLLLVMSLMGGALIVISAGDHQKSLEMVSGGAGPTSDITIANTCAMLHEISIP